MYMKNLIQPGNIRELSWTLLRRLWNGKEIRLFPVFKAGEKEEFFGIRPVFQEQAIFHLFSGGLGNSFFLMPFLFLTAFTAKSNVNPIRAAVKASQTEVCGFENLDSKSFLLEGMSTTEGFDFEKYKVPERSGSVPDEMPIVNSAKPEIQPFPLYFESSLDIAGIIPNNALPALDTVPLNDKEKHEFDLLERMIRQLSKTVENMKHELYVTKTSGIEELRKAVEARERELNNEAQRLEQKSEELEKNEVDDFQVQKARQYKDYETAVQQLNGEKEKIGKDTIQKVEKQMETQRMQLNRAIWDLQLQRSDLEAKKGKISAEEYEVLEYEQEQAERHLKETVQAKLDQQKIDFERELENGKMKLQFEEEQLELQKKQMDLTWKQHELQLEDQREAILSEKRDLELQQKELAAQDIEKVQKKLEIQRKLAAEEIEMLEISLKILEKEWERRNKER